MTVLQIWMTPDFRPNRKVPFEIVETDFADLDEALVAIASGALICGTALHTRWGDEPNERIVYREAPLAFRGSAVDRVELPSWTIVREVAEPLLIERAAEG
jgi:hypothetical protein